MADPRYWLTTQFPAGQDLERQLAEIKRARRTGALTIEFLDGRPAGELTWRERLKAGQGAALHGLRVSSVADAQRS